MEEFVAGDGFLCQNRDPQFKFKIWCDLGRGGFEKTINGFRAAFRG